MHNIRVNKQADWEFVLEACIIALLGVSISYIFVFIRVWDWTDFPGQWRICAYVMKGINHYPYIGIEDIPDAVTSIGMIPSRECSH